MSDQPRSSQPLPRRPVWLLTMALALWGGAVVVGDPPAATPREPERHPLPPLEVDEDAPLLLDEPSPNARAQALLSAGSGHDINAACYVCHVNFKQDPFVQWHAKTNIGCIKCHGESRAHVADEANLTPPDILYWPSKVGFSCFWCHPTHDVPARDVLARFQERCAHFPNPLKVRCTDCHGQHRLHVRTIIWNKRTGALISKSGPTNAPTAPAPAEPVSAALSNLSTP